MIFRFCRFLCWILAKIYFRFQAFGVENIPEKGGLILAPNHSSYLDPPLSGIALKRPTHFFARNTLMRNAFLKWFFNELNCIPVNREQLDTKTFREVVKRVKNGQIVVMFPEGTRSQDGKLQSGKPGTGMLVQHAGVKVVPCYIDGAARALPRGTKFPKPRKIRVFYGPPLEFKDFTIQDKRQTYTQISEQIMQQIALLKEKAEESVIL